LECYGASISDSHLHYLRACTTQAGGQNMCLNAGTILGQRTMTFSAQAVQTLPSSVFCWSVWVTMGVNNK